jgi:hypothetical protein
MPLLDSFVGIFAYSIIIIPIAFLIVVAFLYHYKPTYKKSIGIVALCLGSIGLVIFSFVLLISISEGSGRVLSLSAFLVSIEVITTIIGIKSLKERNTNVKF